MWGTVGFCCGAKIDSLSFMSLAQNLAQTINYTCIIQFLPPLNLENVSENHSFHICGVYCRLSSLLHLSCLFSPFLPETCKIDEEQTHCASWFKNSLKEKNQSRNHNDLTKGGELNAHSCIPISLSLTSPIKITT